MYMYVQVYFISLSIVDEDALHINELTDQLKAQEAKLNERKLRHQQQLDSLKNMRIQQQSQIN